MKKWINNTALFFSIIALDQFTKWLALVYAQKDIVLLPFLSFRVVFNRGISWGLLHTDKKAQFIMVTALIISIIGLLAWITVKRWKRGKTIVGEVLVLAGAISNLLDRFFFHGVIDFISLSYNGWSWPYFNIADISIVVGVILMCYTYLKEK